MLSFLYSSKSLNIRPGPRIRLKSKTASGVWGLLIFLKEDSNEDLIPFIQYYQSKGIQYVICTDIAKDGMLEGPSFDLYAKILAEAKDIKLIASGGISTFDELPKLAELGCEGTIIGKAIYEGRISLKQLENYILSIKL